MDHNYFYLYMKYSVGEQETMIINWNLEVLTECEENHFHRRTIKHWYREAAETPSLEVFKICLEIVLSNLV